jgi:hypothetical protein
LKRSYHTLRELLMDVSIAALKGCIIVAARGTYPHPYLTAIKRRLTGISHRHQRIRGRRPRERGGMR